MSERRVVILLGTVFLYVGLLMPSAYGEQTQSTSPDDDRLYVIDHLLSKNDDAERIKQAIHEADSLYSRLVAILNNVDIPERYDAVEDILQELWERIVSLESRYSDIDPDVLSEALFSDEEFVRLDNEFERQMERLRTELPDQAMQFELIIEEGVNRSSHIQMQATIERAVDLFEELVETLESIETIEDAEQARERLGELARGLRSIEGNDAGFTDLFREHMANNDYAVSLSQRFEAVIDSFGEDSEMRVVLEALGPLYSREGRTKTLTPDEQKALADYQTLIEQSIVLLAKLKTPDDVDRYADEIRELGRLEAKVNQALPGPDSEAIIESDPELVKLLQKLGAEQMRIMDNPEMGARLSKVFSGE